MGTAWTQHTIVHGVPGVGYVRRAYRIGQAITGTDGQRYTVTFVRDDGDVFGDGAANLEVFTEPAPEDYRVCQG
jgi:hypothetical protein